MHKKIMRRVIFLLAAVFMISCGSLSYADTNNEPIKLNIGTPFTGNQIDDEQYYFEFEVDKPGKVTINFSTKSDVTEGYFGCTVYVEDEHDWVYSGSTSWDSLNGKFTYSVNEYLEKGKYFYTFDCSGNGTYTLEYQFEEVQTTFIDTNGKEDNTVSTAHTTDFNKKYYGLIMESDRDVYKFSLPQKSAINVKTELYGTGWFLYKLYDENLDCIEKQDFGYYGSGKFHTTHELETGNYYLEFEVLTGSGPYDFSIEDGEHKWNKGVVLSDNSCTKDGLIKYTCEKEWCKHEKTQVLKATGHKYGSWMTAASATCTSAGKQQRTCSSCKKVDSKTIAKLGHNYSTAWTVDKAASTSASGSKSHHCKRCDVKKDVTTIAKIKSIKLSKTTYAYNGNAKSPAVEIKNTNGKTISSKNYTVTKAKGRTNVGKYSYKITFKNEYQGTKTLYFKINPKATTIKTPVAAKKGFTVKWSKVSKQATGYEIMYATNSKFTTGKKTVKVTSYKTTSKKISKLKEKKTYYVKVRTYKIVDGVKYYSTWSDVKKVKTK